MNSSLSTRLRLLSLVMLIVAVSASSVTIYSQEEEPCDFILTAEQSLSAAVDEASSGDIVCLDAGLWQESFQINKSLVLRGVGREESVILGSDINPQVLVIVSDDEIEVSIVGIAVQGSLTDGIGIGVAGSANVDLSSVLVEDHGVGIFVGDNAVLRLNSSVILNNSAVSESAGEDFTSAGIRIADSAVVVISDSRVEGSGVMGVFGSDLSSTTITDSLITMNLTGIAVLDGASAAITDSRVAENHEQGVAFFNDSLGSISDSLIIDNGSAIACQSRGNEPGGEICNGLILRGSPDVILRDSSISGNGDWGVAASLRVCGYNADEFSGSLIFEGANSISGNNLSGNQNEDGNPGAHPFGNLAPGQVCLP